MERGVDFVRAQINHAVAQHQTLVDMLAEHRNDAKDERFRALCSRYLGPMHQMQVMLGEYQQAIGGGSGPVRGVMARAAGFVRDMADRARDSDYHKLATDLVAAHASEDMFWTFHEAGMHVGDARLELLGEAGARGHADYITEARQLMTTLFVEYTSGLPRSATAGEREVPVAIAQLADTDTMAAVPRAVSTAHEDAGPMGPAGPGASYGSLDEQNRDVARDT
jgi:hypothetical protein